MFCDKLLMCKKYLKNNLKKDFIRLSKSQVTTSVLFVKKSGSELQFCIDYWALNIITVKNHYLISLFKKILHWLFQVKWYIKLDIITVYNALQISSEKEWKTAFHTCYSLYEYLIMLFELINVSSNWQHFINDILWEYLNEFCITYLNNILIYSDTEKKHVKHVNWVLAQLQKTDIQADIEKCVFRTQKVKYLSLIIDTDSVCINLIKVQVIQKWSVSKCLRDILSFLDFVNFYCHFIEGFSKIVRPLTELTKKDILWN